VQKTVDGRTIHFAWDDDLLLSDVQDPESPREFIFRPHTFEPLASLNGRLVFYETDQVGLPHDVLDERGKSVWRGSYDALAGLRSTDVHQETNPLRLQGQYFDAETGLAYNRHRYYDPETEAFISQDPLRQAAGTNLYRYAPNVWSWVDIFGLNCVSVFRVEKPGIPETVRVHIDDAGNIKIPNKDDVLHVSFGSPEHALYFAAKEPGSVIKTFDVPESVVKDIQSRALPQRPASRSRADKLKTKTATQIDDPGVVKELGMPPKSALGLRGSDIEALEKSAIPGSGKVVPNLGPPGGT
jgi:RHS repeat-associated protein